MKILSRLNSIFLLFIAFSGNVLAIQYLQGFPGAKPQQIFTDDDGKFYVDYGDFIYIYNKGKTKTVTFRTQYGNMHVGRRHTTVMKSGLIVSHVYTSYTYSYPITVNGTTTYTTVTNDGWFLETCNPACTQRSVSGNLSDEGFVYDAHGNLYFEITGKSQHHYYINNTHVSKAEYTSAMNRFLPVEIHTQRSDKVLNALDPDIVIHYPKDRSRVTYTARFRGEHSIVWDNENNPHIFYHDPGARIFHHAFYSYKAHKIIEQIVDQKESGYENVAFAEGDFIWTISYFYRNAFNKGLLATKMDNTGKIINQFVLDASQKNNIGWNLACARASNGTILLSYATNGNSGKQRYLLLTGTRDLIQMGNNLASYGHIRGSDDTNQLTPAQQQALGRSLADSYLKDYKAFELSVGVGAQYAYWTLKAESDINYKIDNAFVNLLDFQGKFYDVDYGFEYAKDAVKPDSTQTGGNSVIEYASAYIGWEKLMYNYDFKLNLEQSKTRVRLTDAADNIDFNYTMNYASIKLSLLSQQRMQFGFEYQNFNQYRKISKYTYTTGPGWQYNTAAIGELDTKVYAAHYGYSTLSYLEKYGVKANRLYFDLDARGGFVQHQYKGTSTSPWGERPNFDIALMVGTQFEAGWIWFQRWKSLKALGGFVKVGYRVNIDYYPDQQPNNDNKGDNGETRYVLSDAYMLRHGPLAMVGLNF